jgi:hypothetical protein
MEKCSEDHVSPGMDPGRDRSRMKRKKRRRMEEWMKVLASTLILLFVRVMEVVFVRD